MVSNSTRNIFHANIKHDKLVDKMKCVRCNEEYEGKECLACKLEPYYRKSLESGKARDQFTVELNGQERIWLEQLKVRWDFKSDSKILKLCLENAINSKNVSWSEETWRYVLSLERQRLSKFKKLPEVGEKENAMQK